MAPFPALKPTGDPTEARDDMRNLTTRTYQNEWVDALDVVRVAGLMDGFTYSELFEALGGEPSAPFHPGRFAALMHRFYQADGDGALSLARRRRDGYAGASAGEAMNAWRGLARLIGAAPSLSGVMLANGPSRTHDPAGHPFEVDDGWVSFEDLVDAANAMLEVVSGERFVPLVPHPRGEGFLRLDPLRARALERIGLLDADWAAAFGPAFAARKVA